MKIALPLDIPWYVPGLFYLSTLGVLFFLWQASTRIEPKLRKRFMLGYIGWIILQLGLGYTGFYSDHMEIKPPRILFGIVPALVFVLWVVFTKAGQRIGQGFDVSTITWLHTVRIPVEFGLYALAVFHAVPELMTFDGENPDMLSGISAPLAAFWAAKQRNKAGQIAWNMICLLLLINIVVHAFFSAPTPFQKLAFDAPNVAIFFSPFILLPTCIVPMVLMAHLISLRKLFNK